MKLPKMDVEAVLSHHRRNLEALEKSARAAAAGATSVVAKQREALQETHCTRCWKGNCAPVF